MIPDQVDRSWSDVVELCLSKEKKIAMIKDTMCKNLVIFGAGVQGLIASRYLKQCGLKISCFTDNDADKHGIMIDDTPVVSPNDPLVLYSSMVIIAARNALLSIRQQLDQSAIPSIAFDAFFVAHEKYRIAHVRNNLLGDDRSRIIYDAILKTMLTGDSSYCASVMENNQYFAIPEFVNIENDHFVDAGAYVGDTLERFIWINSGIFMKIYAFEPGKPQMNAMKHRVQRLCNEWAISKSDIICENAGLSDKNSELPINISCVLANTSLHESHNCLLDNNEIEKIHCYSLDSYLAGRPATFIKADIEGMELSMLKGARKTIKRYKPKMALSIYHNPSHIIEIAEYVNSLNPEYHMAIRHHSPIFAESVLYCWIP
ncbi:MAG: FkbM family methyltransferase [Desulfamplus sp.]|nr:FkbM family methyltransferase [Desulfamplus sp.]